MVGRKSLFVFVASGLVATGMLSAADSPTSDSKASASNPKLRKPVAVAPPTHPASAPAIVHVAPEKSPSKPTLPAAAEVPTSTTAVPTPLSRQRRQRRQQWERLLQTPADLTLDDQQSITLGTLLDQIRKKHGLNVQIDLAHVIPLALLTESESEKVELKRPSKKTARHSAMLPSLGRPVESFVPDSIDGKKRTRSTMAVGRHRPANVTVNADGEVEDNEDGNGRDSSSKQESLPSIQIESSKNRTASEQDEETSKPEVEIKRKHDDDDDDDADCEIDEGDGITSFGRSVTKVMGALLSTPLDAAVVVQPNATIEDVVRQAFDRAYPMQSMLNAAMSEEMPMLASLTQATEWELLVQDHGVLITTRLNANLQKETRVYSLRAMEQSSKIKAEDVARIVTRTVRPWSWKKYFPDATEDAQPTPSSKSKSKVTTKTSKTYSVPKIDLGMLSLLLSSRTPVPSQHIRLASDDDSSDSGKAKSDSENVELTEEQLELMGRAWDGLFQTAVSSIQVIYHADPPTGVIEVLPGLLIISQSQGAHREIADLLEQLAHPESP